MAVFQRRGSPFRLLMLLLFVPVIAGSSSSSPYQATISRLYQTVQSLQTRSNETTEVFNAEDIRSSGSIVFAGQYASQLQVNFHGDEVMAMLRNKFMIQDTNFYVTGLVLEILLESAQLGAIDLDVASVEEAISLLNQFQDKNKEAGTFIFWPQVLENGTWVASPPNLGHDINKAGSIADAVHQFLDDLHLEWVWNLIKGPLSAPQYAAMSFVIPGDTDDTAVGLAIDGLLKRSQYSSPLSALWKQNVTSALATVLQYTYCPFADNLSRSSIDTRSYYFLHTYLQKVQKEKGNDPTFCLPTVWTENIDEQRTLFFKNVSMPYNTNNIDGAVAANFIFGVTQQLLVAFSKPGNSSVVWFSTDLQQLYNNTIDYLCWLINSESLVMGREDLGIPYYPPLMAFYWFAARTVAALESYATSDTMPDVVLNGYRRLAQSLRGNGTAVILSQSKTDNEGNIYWEDFLGDNDTELGVPIQRHEDRLFTTAVALNALLDIWSFSSENGTTRQWNPSAPSLVQNLIVSSAKYLSSIILSGDFLPSNALFGGSVEGTDQNPLLYPATYYQFLNGTSLNQSEALNPHMDVNSLFQLIAAVSGLMSDSEFQEQLAALKTPVEWPGYGADIYPYWSAPAVTYASAALAFAKIDALS